MKKKLSLWLNIATICLCICAIAIGVYAAQSATLSVTGSIGFTAHNLTYIASAKAKGYVTDTEDADTYVETLTAIGGNVENDTLSLTNMYFTDLVGDEVPNIEIELTITNTSSAFDIYADVTSATCEGVTITYTMLESTGKISKNNGTITITFVLELIDENNDLNKDVSTNNLSISIELNKNVNISAKTDSEGNVIKVQKYTDQDGIRAKTVGAVTTKSYGNDKLSYAERFPYYINMGKSSSSATEEDIKWLIVGYMEGNADGTTTLKTLTSKDETAFSKGYMLAGKDYVLLSAEALSVVSNSSNYGIDYQTKFVYSGIYPNDYGVSANDYLTSNVRSYLKNNEVYRSSYCNNADDPFYEPKTSEGKLTQFETMYSLDTSILYDMIKGRKVSDLYADIITEAVITSVPTSVEGYAEITENGSTEDKFWLLSYTEVKTLFSKDCITDTPSADNYYCASAITTVLNSTTTSPVDWWLRSPYHWDDYAYTVSSTGSVSDYGSVAPVGSRRDLAVRPAFILKGE